MINKYLIAFMVLLSSTSCSTEKASDLRTKSQAIESQPLNSAGDQVAGRETQSANQAAIESKGPSVEEGTPKFCAFLTVFDTYSCLRCQPREFPGYICSKNLSLAQFSNSCVFSKETHSVSCDLEGAQRVMRFDDPLPAERSMEKYQASLKMLLTQINAVVPSQNERASYVELFNFPPRNAKALFDGNIEQVKLEEFVDIVNSLDPKFKDNIEVKKSMVQNYQKLYRDFCIRNLQAELTDKVIIQTLINTLIDGLPSDHYLVKQMGNRELTMKIVSAGLGL